MRCYALYTNMFFYFLLLILVQARVSARSSSDVYAVKVNHLPTSGKINGLSFNAQYLRALKMDEDTSQSQFYRVYLNGNFQRPGWRLICGKRKLDLKEKKGEDPYFVIKFQTNRAKNVIYMTALGPKGEKEKEAFEVLISSKIIKFKEEKSLGLNLGVGATFLQYAQTGKAAYKAIMLSPKISFFYYISKYWDFGANSYMNVMPMWANNKKLTVRFLGINGRLGIKPQFIKQPWQMSIMLGAYYMTMFVTNNSFGFSNLLGPQFFPVLRKTLNDNNSIFFYFKYSPILANWKFRPQGNREIAVGTGWIIPIGQEKTLSFSLDYSNLKLVIQTITAKSQSVSFGVGYGF